jgi:hypothetical protein
MWSECPAHISAGSALVLPLNGTSTGRATPPSSVRLEVTQAVRSAWASTYQSLNLHWFTARF